MLTGHVLFGGQVGAEVENPDFPLQNWRSVVLLGVKYCQGSGLVALATSMGKTTKTSEGDKFVPDRLVPLDLAQNVYSIAKAVERARSIQN